MWWWWVRGMRRIVVSTVVVGQVLAELFGEGCECLLQERGRTEERNDKGGQASERASREVACSNQIVQEREESKRIGSGR